MGSYSSCWLGPLYLGSTKSTVDPNLIYLYRETDKTAIKASEARNPVSKHIFHCDSDYVEMDWNIIFYKIPCRVLKDRLEIIGYTLNTCRKAFEESVSSELRSKMEYTEGLLSPNLYEEEIGQLIELNPDKFVKSVGSAYRKTKRLLHGMKPVHYEEYSGKHVDGGNWFGYPGYNICVPLRLILESIGENEDFIIDVSDLVNAEYFDDGHDFIAEAREILQLQYSQHCKTIVITEGKYDTFVLSESIALLYPHLADYYSFIDFELYKVSGGVGNVSNAVKIMSGSGISNKILALFDNDTAAMSALRGLQTIRLSENVKAMTLPNLKMLKKYPTIGPDGKRFSDINGRAASIELYLGKDVLRNSDGELMPIQWTGYDEGCKEFQGEIILKREIHNRFEEKLRKCKLDNRNIGKYDWSGIKEIFNFVFKSFNDVDGRIICENSHYEY